jgi:hypothetical protein
MPRFAMNAQGHLVLGAVTIDNKQRTISFPVTINQRKGLVEYAVVTAVGPTHESVFRTDAEPMHIHLGMLLLLPQDEVQSAKPVLDHPVGPEVFTEVAWKVDSHRVQHALEEFIVTTNNAKTLATGPWIYTGSVAQQTGLLATTAGTVITIQPDHTALINNPRQDRHNDDLHFVNEAMVPPDDVELRLTIYVEKPALAPAPDRLEGPRPGPPHAGTPTPP